MIPSAPPALRGLVVLVTTLAMASVLVGPSEAAPRRWSKVVVSTDGKHWQRKLSKPLIDTKMVWVPGDTVTRKFYVGNRSGQTMHMSLRLVVKDRARLMRSGAFRFYLKTGKKWGRVANPAGGWRFKVTLRPAKVRTVWVRVSMSPSAGNPTMNRREPLVLKMRLTAPRRP